MCGCDFVPSYFVFYIHTHEDCCLHLINQEPTKYKWVCSISAFLHAFGLTTVGEISFICHNWLNLFCFIFHFPPHFRRLRKTKLDQRKLADEASTVVDMAKVRVCTILFMLLVMHWCSLFLYLWLNMCNLHIITIHLNMIIRLWTMRTLCKCMLDRNIWESHHKQCGGSRWNWMFVIICLPHCYYDEVSTKIPQVVDKIRHRGCG